MVQVRRVSLCLLMVCLVLGQTSAQLENLNCSLFTIDTLGSTSELSTDGLLADSFFTVGETRIRVPVKINNYTILCDASGIRRNTSSFVSVLVRFQCSFQGGSGNLAQCDGMTNIIRQYQYECSRSNVWENAGVVETLTPTATFQTEPTNQCRQCGDLSEFTSADQDTHCVRCQNCNQGQGRCYVQDFAERCCNYYVEDNCTDMCPAPLVPNDNTFDCECPPLSLGNSGSVEYTRLRAIGSVATHTCMDGYDLVGGVTRICTRDGWSGNSSSCSLIKCPLLSDIESGSVSISPPDRTLNAQATYTCETDYSIRSGDEIRICQSGSVWSGVEPKCVLDCGGCGPGICNKTTGKCACPSNYHGEHCSKLCKASDIDPDCIECAFDGNGNPICSKCKGDIMPRDGKCPVQDGNTSPSTCDTGCVVGIVLAILGAIIMAVVVALVVYAVYSYLTNPATKLAKAGTEGLNGVARDNPLYLPPDEIVGDVETS